MSNNQKLNNLVNERNEIISHINYILTSGDTSELSTLNHLAKDVSALEKEISDLESMDHSR